MDNNTSSTEPTENPEIDKSAKNTRWQQTLRNPLWWLVFVLTVPGLVAIWLIWQQQQLLITQNDQLSPLVPLPNQVAAATSAHKKLQQQVNEQQQMLDKQAATIRDLEQRERLSDREIRLRWTLSEIDYLLQLANQRSMLAKDVAGARQALTLADDKLQTLDDYRLQPLREQIAEEKLALDAVSKADIAGMSADIQSVIQGIDRLQVVKGPKPGWDPVAETAANSQVASSWRQAASEIWQQLRSLVVIRQQDDAPAAVLMPEQRYFLYQNLRLQLETARFALLSGKQNVFESSLQSSIDWLAQYFTGDQRDAVLASLQTMKSKSIAVQIPDISGSLRWLEEFQP
ncbi:uroporphyrinogen III [Methylophaga frappieri]|uniref:Uroporphyrinogen III n=1 Tax=Methylophaga frappieri (strain ATCC BAA-2434 / DSM 25690 / JAM7) TaxID=754477 RepID=I1YJA6_METFJ|nr:uroporphyrinogen-III C-methyltransferase [Methylophaga frappieri]AFJ02999.1 uroporphyrinogen III [Methylophaga frappieri]